MTLFSREQWAEVGRNLRGGAFRWWKQHEDLLVGLGEDEVASVALALKARNTTRAKLILAKYMSREDWAAWRDSTTIQIGQIADRRAEAREAIGRLSWWAARSVGAALLGALGL